MAAAGFCLAMVIMVVTQQVTCLSWGAGFIKPVSPDSTNIVSMGRWAAKKMDARLVTVLSANEQVVAGMLYRLDLLVFTHDKLEACKVKVWSKVWLKWRRLIKKKCTRV